VGLILENAGREHDALPRVDPVIGDEALVIGDQRNETLTNPLCSLIRICDSLVATHSCPQHLLPPEVDDLECLRGAAVLQHRTRIVKGGSIAARLTGRWTESGLCLRNLLSNRPLTLASGR